MPQYDAPLLFALLAFHRKYISREQLLEATAAWMTSPEMDLGRLLVEGKYLLPEQHSALEKLVADWGRTHSTARGSVAPEMTRELRDTMVALRRARQAAGAAAPAASATKYDLGAELGRGGLGRVVEAADRELGRKVALKLLLEDAPQDLMDRFKWEAKITGRLEHPNIVPVHEVGMLPGTREMFLCMKRIVGRDMSDVIHDGKWTLRRLVEAFRDTCRAIAYAHSMGVMHRDIKPANVMLGDFGEVLVVDWGLARLVGEEDRPSQFRRATTTGPRRRPTPIARKEESQGLTLEGDILGTPSYMPPEQALGRLQELDERSDVYSLGATLYEILAHRPPFDGEAPQDVLDQVVGKPLPKPSSIRPCPPELEAICLKAMAYEQARRHTSVKALQAEIEAWLEGTAERERRQKMADERVARAQEEAARWRRLRGEAAEAAREADEKRRALSPRARVEERRPAWALADRSKALEREAEQAFSESNEAVSSALALLPDHAAARRLKAEIFWEKYLEVEAKGGGAMALHYRHSAEACNDGSLDARIRGDGTLSVRTVAYPCACLGDGRPVERDGLWTMEYHAWSGRRRDGAEVDDARELEEGAPWRLRVHGAECRPAELPGAEAWAFRYEEEDRRLVPVTPAGTAGGSACPAAVLDELWGSSPYRPLGPGIAVGRTPAARRAWPHGSWVLVVAAPGRAARRVPFVVPREGAVDLEVVLLRPGETPPGYLPVSGGTFESVTDSGDPSEVGDTNRHIVDLEDFLIARHPVTCREYLEFLNDLAARDPGQAAARAPRATGSAVPYWPLVGGRWALPTTAYLAGATEEIRRTARLSNSAADWEPEWPVLDVSWIDAQAYAKWLSLRTGFLFTQPHMYQWERAARGADTRVFPWGNEANASLCNVNNSHAGGGHPVAVEDFPTDESPFGVRGMGGNAHSRCLNDPGANYRHWRAIRGGAWSRTITHSRIASHIGGPIRGTQYILGIRCAAVLRLQAPP